MDKEKKYNEREKRISVKGHWLVKTDCMELKYKFAELRNGSIGKAMLLGKKNKRKLSLPLENEINEKNK